MFPTSSVTSLRLTGVHGRPMSAPYRRGDSLEPVGLLPRPVAAFLEVAVSRLRWSAESNLQLLSAAQHSVRYTVSRCTTGASDVTKAEKYSEQYVAGQAEFSPPVVHRATWLSLIRGQHPRPCNTDHYSLLSSCSRSIVSAKGHTQLFTPAFRFPFTYPSLSL